MVLKLNDMTSHLLFNQKKEPVQMKYYYKSKHVENLKFYDLD